MEETNNIVDICSRCHKKFKSKKIYKTHIEQQLCFSSGELSYCKICDLTLDNHKSYVKHIMTIEHINNIGCNKLERLNNNLAPSILTVDPFLTQNEANLIGTNNLGTKFIFVYENNEQQTVNLVRDNTVSNNAIAEPISSAPDRILMPSPRQKKLLLYLAQQKTINEGVENFTRLLSNGKLTMEDYYGFNSIIREHTAFSNEYRIAYLATINKFVENLVKMKNSGQPIYHEKDISKLVVGLTL
jgi:uncharacterized C2H2 Zn-finger protein